MNSDKISPEEYDLICAGGGIMSATLALILKMLNPDAKVLILERLEKVSQESSAAWNNSGTGHSGFCELNYTPEEQGKIDVSKALEVFSQYERSKQFWAYLLNKGWIDDPQSFIHSVPHHSWVTGEDNVGFMKKRFTEMQKHPPFGSMKFSEDPKQMMKWFPLIMKERESPQPMAATRMEMGTEVNFEELTKHYFRILEEKFATPVLTRHEVSDIDPEKPDDWLVEVKNLGTGGKSGYNARHVFIGAGGGALPLLQKVEIEEKEGYGGFPVSGQWLVCKNEEVIKQHRAKVYSKAGPDAPPMSTPHLDTRYVNGKRELMFGPFAGFSTKFLKEGSWLDLPKTLRFKNLPAYWGVFWHNLPLTRYLVGQLTMDHEDRMEELREFVKEAKSDEWELQVAGQRVQIIKRDKEEGGILEFGTDVIHSKDGTITALLGASPGASTAVHIMLEVLQFAFPEKAEEQDWKNKLSKMIPFWNKEAIDDKEDFEKVQRESAKALGLQVLH